MKPIYKYISAAAVILVTGYACSKKPSEGFLGRTFFYLSNPFIGAKGRIVTSAPIQADGSTNPLYVKLLQVRNRAGQVTDALTKEYEIPIYKGEVTPQDSTPQLLAAKLGTAMYKPFNINSIGGRLELTPASAMVDTGLYTFDIEVSNIRGSKTINSVAKVQLTPAVPSQLVRQFANSSAVGQETVFTTQTNFTTTLERRTGPNQIIIRFLDQNGVAFNPKQGQVLPREGTATAPRYVFKQFAPYYPEVINDTAFIYQYPEKTPTFPLYLLNNAYLSSYRIPAAFNTLNQNINPEFAFRLYPTDGVTSVSGTWVITNRIGFAAKK
jgi:hypothetical protein|eukprot:TRINITY_DN12478_c0_g1_i1.p1 TRINITY_DN12478_c0_g1~~TRINITY_DN12478_c0_g1_i1.p1  ORF type:complete len:325 (-),score=-24.56 TRINITY_DN12478_c0_g1_i1:886-1860(-)